MKKGTITILILAIASVAAAEIKFEPGKEVRLDAGKPAGKILVYVPADYNDDCNWPVIFNYHGQGGQITTQWLQIATGGKGFIVVGIEFADTVPGKLTPIQYRAYIAKEIKNLAYVRHFVEGKLKINQKMTILSGVSMGGWLVSDIFCVRPQLAAAAVITAAGYHDWLPENSSPMTGKYVYIGAGENDKNLEPAKKAAAYFANRNASVMLEIYPGLGHQIDPNAPKLQRWLAELRNKLK